MADFEAIIRKHVGDDGTIPTSAINAIVTAIKTAVGNEFVDKERYKAKLSEIELLKEQKQTAEDNATTAEKWKTKYDGLKSELADYKAQVEQEKTHGEKANAYKAMLKEIGVSEKRIDSVLKVSDVDGIELDKDGKIKGVDELKETVKNEWADFISTDSKKGADVSNPPGGESKNDFSDIRSMTARWHAAKYGEMPKNEN